MIKVQNLAQKYVLTLGTKNAQLDYSKAFIMLSIWFVAYSGCPLLLLGRKPFFAGVGRELPAVAAPTPQKIGLRPVG
ncbi:MAG: hypothetical protein EOO49_00590 [Flavobacterium sp.]|nr:MAG: hypothetical protein EOO49_00590 [Flavobacterium sp.]